MRVRLNRETRVHELYGTLYTFGAGLPPRMDPFVSVKRGAQTARLRKEGFRYHNHKGWRDITGTIQARVVFLSAMDRLYHT